jgi:predicted ATP-dependent serine protease
MAVRKVRPATKEHIETVIVQEVSSREILFSGSTKTVPRVGETLKIAQKVGYKRYTVQNLEHEFSSAMEVHEIRVLVLEEEDLAGLPGVKPST